MCPLKTAEFITSVIKTASIIPIFANPKLATGAFTAVNELIAPIVLIQPGTAIGVAGEGIPKDKPPVLDTKPAYPADIPTRASTLVLEVIISALIEPETTKSAAR
jgi:hypothetical protein